MISNERIGCARNGYTLNALHFTIEKYSHYCRESFETHFKDNVNKVIHFRLPSEHTLEKTHENFMLFENKLKLLDGESVFGRCDYEINGSKINGVIWIKPHKVWLGDSICRSLFTLLLRASAKTKENDYNKIVESELSLKETELALEKFLDGNTKINFVPSGESKHLWNYYLRLKNKNELERLLVKP